MKVRSLLVAVCLLESALTAFSQTDRGTITGTVSDATGAVLPGATVEAKNVGTGAVYTAGSSETGNFTLAQLPAGIYDVSALLPGFKKFVRPGIIVQVAQVVRVDATLEVGANTESITVEAAAPLLKTESGEVSHNVSTDTLDSLPVLTLGSGTGMGNIRNPLQAITLLPGSAFVNENTLRINGMPSSTQAIRIDGQDATNGLWRQLNQTVQPSVDAMQEVAVQTGNYDYNDFRWQRQPSEALSLGRNFRVAAESKVVFNVLAEFQNVFNRLPEQPERHQSCFAYDAKRIWPVDGRLRVCQLVQRREHHRQPERGSSTADRPDRCAADFLA